jgi:hypothetical protein
MVSFVALIFPKPPLCAHQRILEFPVSIILLDIVIENWEGMRMEMEEADKLTKYLIENLRVSLLYYCSVSETQLRNLGSEISYLLGKYK